MTEHARRLINLRLVGQFAESVVGRGRTVHPALVGFHWVTGQRLERHLYAVMWFKEIEILED